MQTFEHELLSLCTVVLLLLVHNTCLCLSNPSHCNWLAYISMISF